MSVSVSGTRRGAWRWGDLGQRALGRGLVEARQPRWSGEDDARRAAVIGPVDRATPVFQLAVLDIAVGGEALADHQDGDGQPLRAGEAALRQPEIERLGGQAAPLAGDQVAFVGMRGGVIGRPVDGVLQHRGDQPAQHGQPRGELFAGPDLPASGWGHAAVAIPGVELVGWRFSPHRDVPYQHPASISFPRAVGCNLSVWPRSPAVEQVYTTLLTLC